MLAGGHGIMHHHNIDPYPIPKDKSPIYINEPWIIDKSICDKKAFDLDQGGVEDNIRVYVPLDISADAIIRRLNHIISFYGEANEDNEFNFSADLNLIISQVEIYDQIWGVRHGMNEKGHSTEAIALIREIVTVLEKIPDGCAEFFPFEIIDELQAEYL